MMKIFISLLGVMLLLILGNEAFASCVVTKNSCEAYRCLNEKLSCRSAGDYLENFAIPFCEKFLKEEDESLRSLSANARVWLEDVRSCLQEELVARSDIACEKLGDVAIDSHLVCYMKTHFCSLTAYDKSTVIKNLSSSIGSSYTWGILTTGAKLSLACKKENYLAKKFRDGTLALPPGIRGKSADQIISDLSPFEEIRLCHFDWNGNSICDIVPYFQIRDVSLDNLVNNNNNNIRILKDESKIRDAWLRANIAD